MLLEEINEVRSRYCTIEFILNIPSPSSQNEDNFKLFFARYIKLFNFGINKNLYNMKTMHLFIFVLGTFFACVACDEKREEAPIDNKFGQLITLKVGESSDIQEGTLAISFDKLVEDSRCPNGVDCIWQGQAKVQLLVNKTTTVDLIMQAGKEALAIDTLDNYIYTLLDVSPYPDVKDELPLPEEAYIVEVQVDKL